MSGITIPVLLEGRLKVCYSCKLSGHVKSECTIVKYRVCYEFGHDDPGCQKQIIRRCVIGTSSNLLVTTTTIIYTPKPTSVVAETQLKIKICYGVKSQVI
jgi:hypothetical protein